MMAVKNNAQGNWCMLEVLRIKDIKGFNDTRSHEYVASCVKLTPGLFQKPKRESKNSPLLQFLCLQLCFIDSPLFFLFVYFPTTLLNN